MQFKSPEDFHNKLGLLFHSMLAVPLLVFVYLFLEIKHRDFKVAIVDDSVVIKLIALLLLLAAGILFLGYNFYRKSIRKSDVKDDLKEKLSIYFNSSVIFYAVVESAGCFMIVGLYLTASNLFVVGFMFVLLILSLNRPTPIKYIKDLRLEGEDKEIILNKKDFED